jgi:hypothetical protein
MIAPRLKRERLTRAEVARRVAVTLGGAMVGGLMMGQLSMAAGGGGNPEIVQVAAGQLGVQEVPLGSNTGPQVRVFTAGNTQAWCADFVSWVYMRAGHPLSGGAGGWRYATSDGLRRWFMARGTWNARDSSDVPQPGDVVTFNLDSDSLNDHTGIIERVSGSTLYTIEGNTSNGVHRRSYPNYKTDRRIVGWGRLGGEATAAPGPSRPATPTPTVVPVSTPAASPEVCRK